MFPTFSVYCKQSKTGGGWSLGTCLEMMRTSFGGGGEGGDWEMGMGMILQARPLLVLNNDYCMLIMEVIEG